jgi:CBS-domain-containing membrane protein
MTDSVASCAIDDSLNDAAHVMWERDHGAIPVIDRDGRLTGMLTDRDICMAAYTQGKPLRDIPVNAVMTTNVLACHIDDSLDTAVQLMREGQVHRVPVLDNDGRPIGILSLNDLGRLASRAGRDEPLREVVQTLNAVSEPRTPSADAGSQPSKPTRAYEASARNVGSPV